LGLERIGRNHYFSAVVQTDEALGAVIEEAGWRKDDTANAFTAERELFTLTIYGFSHVSHLSDADFQYWTRESLKRYFPGASIWHAGVSRLKAIHVRGSGA